ncbi:Atu4866 domain-containing protein [Olivibacter sp. SDN3]|uniref:Atu4866 domain-containing protein n=1 Tax=Olivibacter sp. SDN3 TaxID=2764720 RepID=UPI001650F685|nr:Atu4866 domain-containing protein [Olivibacter sp. SDN3]
MKKPKNIWVTENGYIGHELRSNNRYDETRGEREQVYQGSYKTTGNHIDYRDDTGFIADGEFKDGIFHHAGIILYKEK